MSDSKRWPAAAWLGLVLAMGLSACGGGGGSAGAPLNGSGSSGNAGAGAVTPTLPAIVPSASVAQQCAPGNELAAPGQRNASLSREKQWLRAYFDEAYLWRSEVPQVDAEAAAYGGSAVYPALEAYFEALKTPRLTASGKRRDEFSFIYPTAEWQQLSQAGVATGYGLEWVMESARPPRRIRIAYLDAQGPAARAGLRRGDLLASVDGTSADADDAAGVDRLNAALYPAAAGELHGFVLSSADGSQQRRVDLRSETRSASPVLLSQVLSGRDGRKVGHLVFNDHIAPAEAQLIAAVRDFAQQGIADLVLDLRYNGGGYLYIASELAYMVAGAARSQGKVFEQLSFNERRRAETDSASARTPFYGNSCILGANGCTEDKPLPTLDLERVYVLAQSGTCSASEAIINGLRGIDVEVVLIGGTTCGKPYGFTARDNCGISYFPIEFVGVNAKGFGDYADGFVPGGSGATGVRGCQVADDFGRELGDRNEAMLAAALEHRITGQCPATTQARAQAGRETNGTGLAMRLAKPATRENRILRPR